MPSYQSTVLFVMRHTEDRTLGKNQYNILRDLSSLMPGV